MKTSSTVCLLFLLLGSAHSQIPLSLTLEHSISLALRQGYAVQNASSQYQVSKKTYESSLRKLRTSVDLTLDTPNFSESLSSQFNPLTQRYEFYQIKTTQLTGTLSINQPLVFTGGTFSFRQFLFGRDQLSGLGGSTSTKRDFFNNFMLSFRQPVLTPNVHRLNSDRAAYGLEQVEADFVRNQLDIIYNVTESFYSTYQLLRRLEIARETVKQNEDSYETARSKFNAGLIPEVEVLQSEVDLVTSRNDLLNAERELARSKNNLRLLIGVSLDTEISPTADLRYQAVAIDHNQAIESALKFRTEIQNADRSVELRQIDIDFAESKSDFRIDLNATYGFNKNDADLRNVFRDFGTSRSAALTVSIPVFDWGSNRLEVEAAQIQHRNALATSNYTRQQIRQEIIDLMNRIRVAESRIQVLEKSVAVAQKGYDISLERFRSGNISRNDLAQAQQRLTNAKISNLNALIDYQLGLADLKRKTLWDFEKNERVRPLLNHVN